MKRAATAAKDDKALTAAESIRTEIQRMNLLLTSLAQGNHSTTLEASRTSSVSLRNIVTEVCDIQRLTTPSHEITVTGTWPAVPVHGDPQLLRQLFANLLINAAKYSGADQAISVEAETGPGFVEVAVGDRGIGIPADERERVFEQFYRASNTGAVEGTGLGLTLCRQIVQAHRGTIRIGENVPSGTKITVRLPIGA